MAGKARKCPLCKQRECRKRGLCEPCYRAAMRRIQNGETTDAQLVALDVLKPKSRCGRKASGGGAKIDKLLGK